LNIDTFDTKYMYQKNILIIKKAVDITNTMIS